MADKAFTTSSVGVSWPVADSFSFWISVMLLSSVQPISSIIIANTTPVIVFFFIRTFLSYQLLLITVERLVIHLAFSCNIKAEDRIAPDCLLVLPVHQEMDALCSLFLPSIHTIL